METTRVDLTGNNVIDSLIAGVKWGGGVGTGANVSVSLPYVEIDPYVVTQSALWEQNYSHRNEPWYLPIRGLTAEQIELGTYALFEWANVANLEFSYVPEDSSGAQGVIRVTLMADFSRPDTWGWGYYPSMSAGVGGDIWVNNLAVADDWSLSSSNFASFMHEFGHALGLKHPFEDGATLPARTDSAQFTLMSYADHPYANYRSVTLTDTGYSYEIYPVQPSTPMLYDIAAMQYLYGPNMNHALGDDVYRFDPNEPFLMTIWDAGGNDTITVENFRESCVLDLRAGRFSTVTILSDALPDWAEDDEPLVLYDGTDNLAIAFGVVIENATGGLADDILLGNEADNVFVGNGGNDLIDGFEGIDTLLRSESVALGAISAIGDESTFEYEVRGPHHGVDRIENVERIQFSDAGLALDFDGAAGQTAKILGATFGVESIGNADYVKIGLDLLDAGMTYADLAALAVDAAGARTHAQVVDLLWFNLVGTHPITEEMQPFIEVLEGGESVGAFTVMVAEMDLNASNIDLLGLAQTGLVYSLA